MNILKCYDVVTFAHLVRILEDSGYKFRTNTQTTEGVCIIVEFWKE